MNNFEKRIVDLSAKYDDETPFKKPKLTQQISISYISQLLISKKRKSLEI